VQIRHAEVLARTNRELQRRVDSAVEEAAALREVRPPPPCTCLIGDGFLRLDPTPPSVGCDHHPPLKPKGESPAEAYRGSRSAV